MAACTRFFTSSIFIYRNGIGKNIKERNATVRTLDMHKLRAVALRSDKHAVETE